jgi:hypothetical protein
VGVSGVGELLVKQRRRGTKPHRRASPISASRVTRLNPRVSVVCVPLVVNYMEFGSVGGR